MNKTAGFNKMELWHTANSTAPMLYRFFGDHIVSSNLWSFWSPDPTLWICVYGDFWKRIIKTVCMFEEMKQNIQLWISSITEETCHQVASNLRKSECMHCWGWWTFSAHNITLYLFYDCVNKLVACWWCTEMQFIFMKLKLRIIFTFWHVYVLGGVYSLEKFHKTVRSEVTAAELDTCMANHVTEIVRNVLEAITLTRATYTHE